MHRHLRHSRHLTPPPPTTITTTTGGSPISQEIVYTEASPLYNSSMTTLSSSTVRSFPSSTSPSPNPRRASFLSAAPRISFSALPKSGFSPAISTTGFSRGFRCLRVRSMAATAGTEKKKAVEVFDTEDELAASLAEYTARLSEKFVRERGAFSVVLSGGSLVKSLRKLLAAPYVDAIDWSKWHVLWVDERVVPKDHDDSNYKLAYDSFLSKVPIQSGNVYAINDALSAKGAAEDYETCIKHLVKSGVVASSETTGFPKFDLMLMGMGPDGHIASLFPGHPLINESEKWVTFLNDSPKPPPERISFTLPVINSSSYIALVVAGSGKADAVHTALVNSNNSATLPVQMVSPEGELTWFLDRGAASKL